jgi:hypothetical protein
MRWVRGASAAILVAVLATGCGGSTDDKGASSAAKDGEEAANVAPEEAAAASTTTTTAPDGAGKRSTTTTTAKGGASGGDAGSKSAAARSGVPHVPPGVGEADGSELPSEPLPLAVELSSTCVRPGTPLTVTVKTSPQALVGYDTTWADGKTGWDAPNRNGSARGTADDKGTWTNTATIGADAPKGKARVDVIGTSAHGHMGRTSIEYQVSDALGKCS